MQSWAAANPRAAGVFLIMLCMGLTGLNLAMLTYGNRYYPVLFPVAGAGALVGSLQTITGIRADHGSPLSHRVPALVAGMVGLVLGVVANYVLTGSAL